MNKQEFINEVAVRAVLSKKDAKAAVEAALETITETLANKGSVALIGFGTFTTADRGARTATVPGTSKTVEVPATTVAKFKVGKALKSVVAGK